MGEESAQRGLFFPYARLKNIERNLWIFTTDFFDTINGK